jgi:hypothetical protein
MLDKSMEQKDKLIKELGAYKVKYTQEVLEKRIDNMNNKDDERLRKTTIAFLKDFADKGYENAVECIAWLEKRGEQKLLIEKLPEEMKTIRESLGFTTQEECDNYNQMVTDLIMSNDENEQKSAWSEDDELHIRELESLVKQVWTTAEHENDKDTIHKMSDLSFFLKTLKPQPKQEWSEEEQDIIEDAACVILDCINTAETEKEKKRLEELFDKIQDLTHQSTWKPSDEQMKALSLAMCGVGDPLFSLYQDLEKLKG